MSIRYVALLILTGAAGVLSGLLWLIPNGLMGGALGMCLSLGTIWLGRLQTRQQGELALRQVLMAGFGSGLLAGVLMTGIFEWAAAIRETATGWPKPKDFGPPEVPVWLPLFMGIAYGLAIHWSYWRRRFSRKPLRDTFARTVGVCLLVKTVATPIALGLPAKGLDIVEGLVSSALMALLGAVPFALLWVWITARLDPAWSSPYWQPGKKAEQPSSASAG